MAPRDSRQIYCNDSFQTFYRWLEDNLIWSGELEDPPFLPEDLLTQHLETDGYKVLDTLLDLVFDSNSRASISSKVITHEYSKTFCILSRLGSLEYLPVFLKHDDLCDNRLPFKQRPDSFPRSRIGENLFEDFLKEQWKFCPPPLKVNPTLEFEKDYILPFTFKKQIARGASATIYKIEIYPLYNGLLSLQPQHIAKKDANVFALKTYTGKNAERSWQSEVDAFLKLNGKPSPNIIRFHTALRHGGTFHCILEYADGGSLEHYLKKHLPPTDAIGVACFWKGVLDIFRGLKDLHNGKEVIFHQDIKPANILVLSRPDSISVYDYIFKIGDLGTSHSKVLDATDRDESSPDAQGTRTYGAPECYRPDSTLGEGSIRITPVVDVFSLGCILSEVAVWMAGGNELVEQYQQARRDAITELPDFHDGDCFHDGECVLPVVGQWHEKVKSRLNSLHDIFTLPLLSMIEKMLLDVKNRATATVLCTEAHTTFATALESFQSRWPDQYHLLPPRIRPRNDPGHDQRTEPPVRPSDIDQRSRNANVSLPVSPTYYAPSTPGTHSTRLPDLPVQRQPRSMSDSQRIVQSMHPDEPRPASSQDHATSAPLEGLTDFLEQASLEDRQYSEQQKHGTRPSATRRTNANGHGSPKSIHFKYPGPWSPQTDTATPLSRPSTRLPVNFPPRPAFSHRHPIIRRPNQYAYMSMKEAISWRDNKKTKWTSTPLLRDAWALNSLNNRDSVIIIDDSRSMLEHWEDMIKLLGIFTYMIKSYDKDGLDLYFATSETKYHEDTSSKLVSIVKKRGNQEGLGYTDMSVLLAHVLGQYGGQIQRQCRMTIPTRGLNVYIFTDAMWPDACNIVPAIDRMVETLVKSNFLEEQVGLQFISFGKDPQGLDRLRLVDNYLVSDPKYPYDIVDTTPWDGNLYKMIRGAFDRGYDYSAEENLFPATNPSELPS